MLPRVAALLDVMVIPDVMAVVDEATFQRPVYAGNAVQTVKSSDKIKVFTVRTASFSGVGTGGSAPVEAVAAAAGPTLSAWVEDRVAASDRPELTSAKRIVSGGRAIGSKENFDSLLHDVTTKLFDRLPDETWFYPGHGDDSVLGEERPKIAEWRARGW